MCDQFNTLKQNQILTLEVQLNFFFKKALFNRTVLDLQKNYKNSTVFLFIPHPVSHVINLSY